MTKKMGNDGNRSPFGDSLCLLRAAVLLEVNVQRLDRPLGHLEKQDVAVDQGNEADKIE